MSPLNSQVIISKPLKDSPKTGRAIIQNEKTYPKLIGSYSSTPKQDC